MDNSLPSQRDGTESKDSFDVYTKFKDLINKDEDEFSKTWKYFDERLTIEASYTKELDKLSKKYPHMAMNNGKSSSVALAAFAELNAVTTAEHGRLKNHLESLLGDFSEMKRSLDASYKQLKESVKHEARDYSTRAGESLPKAKSIYFKKAELLSMSQEQQGAAAVTGDKLYRMVKDAEAADHNYRSSIVYVEKARLALAKTRIRAQHKYQAIEGEKAKGMERNLQLLAAVLVSSNGKMREAIETFDVAVSRISGEEDVKLSMGFFMLHWPEREPILFTNYKTKSVAKDLVFGVELDYALRNDRSHTLPPLISYCFNAIETRGLHSEGIYRVSGQKNLFNELKIQVECDVHSVNFMNESEVDINNIAGLVKLFFRELPSPLLVFSPKERAEYSALTNVEERVISLINRLRPIPSENKALLKALCEHLTKIYNESAINKMTLTNLSLIFSGVLFQSQTEQPEDPISGPKNWFKSSQPPDMTALDLMKMDIVFEDMLRYQERIFSSLNYESSPPSPGVLSPMPTFLDVPATSPSLVPPPPNRRDPLPALPPPPPPNPREPLPNTTLPPKEDTDNWSVSTSDAMSIANSTREQPSPHPNLADVSINVPEEIKSIGPPALPSRSRPVSKIISQDKAIILPTLHEDAKALPPTPDHVDSILIQDLTKEGAFIGLEGDSQVRKEEQGESE